eukprot:1185144-Amphidinium_carterae.1
MFREKSPFVAAPIKRLYPGLPERMDEWHQKPSDIKRAVRSAVCLSRSSAGQAAAKFFPQSLSYALSTVLLPRPVHSATCVLSVLAEPYPTSVLERIANNLTLVLEALLESPRTARFV